ncbi:MAG: Sec-independent protein translocase subunit TatA/TatB [Coriobacteriia bacterium]
MFGIGGWEFIVIAVLALLLFGPDKLPQFARTIGRFMRDFKRYQDLMESTIRAEMFAADPNLRKDTFENAKEFRKKVAGGGFSAGGQAAGSEDADEAAGEPIDLITGKPAPPPNEEPDEDEPLEGSAAAAPGSDTASVPDATVPGSDTASVADDGRKGEEGEA